MLLLLWHTHLKTFSQDTTIILFILYTRVLLYTAHRVNCSIAGWRDDLIAAWVLYRNDRRGRGATRSSSYLQRTSFPDADVGVQGARNDHFGVRNDANRRQRPGVAGETLHKRQVFRRQLAETKKVGMAPRQGKAKGVVEGGHHLAQ